MWSIIKTKKMNQISKIAYKNFKFNIINMLNDLNEIMVIKSKQMRNLSKC